jgi:hypothetical protein
MYHGTAARRDAADVSRNARRLEIQSIILKGKSNAH